MAVADLLEFFSTNSLSWEQLSEDADSELMNLHYGLIHVGLSTIVNIGKDTLPYIKVDAIPRNYVLCENGDVSFADASEDTSEVAKVIEFTGIGNEKVVSGLHTIHGRDKQQKTIVGFKGYLFSSESFHKQTRRIAQGSKVFSISPKNFSEIYVSIPSKEEQQKIAELLRLIDERTATQRRLIEDLEKLKSSINETLYATLTTNCKTSFSEIGSDYGGLTGKSAEDFGGGKPFISYLSVYQNQVITDCNFDYVEIRDGENQNKVRKGDLLFTLSSETPEETGYSAVYMGDAKELYLNSFCFGIHIPESEMVYPPYMGYFSSTSYFRRKIIPFAQGSTRFNLHKPSLMSMKFYLPAKEKQMDIFNTLQLLADKILTEKEMLTRFIRQRCYLLSKMFI